jgi:uncharacterized protein (TIGR00369 family)
MTPPPAGFERLILPGPYPSAAAEFYVKRVRDRRVVGAWGEPRHCNSENSIHGGFLLTLADISLTIGSFEPDDAPPRITLSLTADFLRPARQGEWIAAHARLTKKSANIVFADAYVYSDKRLVLRASGVFRPVAPPPT